MRFLANARNDRILCGIREAVAICSANRHCFPIILHLLCCHSERIPRSGRSEESQNSRNWIL